MRDAAQAACVSHAFLRFWRSYARLNFDVYTLGLMDLGRRVPPSFGPIDKQEFDDDYLKKNSPIIRDFSARVDHIMHNHIGTGVQTFRLVPPYGLYIDPALLNRWFQAVIAPGISEFYLYLDMGDEGLGYSFPCSLLSSSNRPGCSTITSFSIAGCGLRSLDWVGCLTTLCTVHLHRMRVTGEQLTCFLSSSPGLQELQLSYCNDIVCLKIPCLLSRLRLLLIATPMKKLNKFRRLKYLEIQLHTPRRCPDFDFYSLVSILNACPVLATFILRLEMPDADDAIPGDFHGDSSQRKRLMMGQGHRKLKNVLMSGFRSAKGLVELTSHILETAASLKHLILDTAYGCNWRDCIGICSPLTSKALMEARKAVDVIKTYIEDKVPSSVNFKVIEPCAKCHADDA
nr:unnamed protein product [Digitaria exilis]